MVHDVNFGGGMPEPKPKYMLELIEKIKGLKNTVGFANDGRKCHDLAFDHIR